MEFKTVDLKELSIMQVQNYLQNCVSPRPIALASTIDAEGNINLSPFSFFNVFSANPPIVIFSPARRARDGSTKHTLENILEVKEVVINIVNYDIVHQTSLSSVEFEKGINEFDKAGFTALKSDIVKPPRVKESPIQMECLVTNVIALGDGPGAGNLVMAEVQKIHINTKYLNEDGSINQKLIGFVARMGGDNYVICDNNSMVGIPKPVSKNGIGVDALPLDIKNSTLLTGNQLGMLGNTERVPSIDILEDFKSQYNLDLAKFSGNKHALIQHYLNSNELENAINTCFID